MSLQPARWLTEHRHLLPKSGEALDVACGRGRHAFWLAAHGFAVRAVDRDPELVADVNADARRLGLQVRAEVADLEAGDTRIVTGPFDVVVVTHYLHRPLFQDLRGALAVGGVLVYETFTRAQAQRGKPTNPAFLLEPGELLDLVMPLDVVSYREGEFDGRFVASVVARK